MADPKTPNQPNPKTPASGDPGEKGKEQRSPNDPRETADTDENDRIRRERGERDTPIRHSHPPGSDDRMRDHPSEGQPKSRVLKGAYYPTTSEPPVQPELAVSLQDGTVPPHTPPTREQPVQTVIKIPGDSSAANAPSQHPPRDRAELAAEDRRRGQQRPEDREHAQPTQDPSAQVQLRPEDRRAQTGRE